MAPHPTKTRPRPNQKEAEPMKKSYFSRPVSDGIKGIALILMFFHHFFTFPHWYVDGVRLPHLEPFIGMLCGPTGICVPVFAFLTGYFFCFSADKSYRRAFRRIRDFLVSYWMVYLPFLVLAMVLGCWTLSWKEAVEGAFGLNSEVMIFCWYVYFFCAVMLLLPLMSRFSTGTLWADVLGLLVLPLSVFCAVRELLPDSYVTVLASYLRGSYPCVAMGFLFAKYDLFETVLEPIGAHFSSRWGKTILWLTMAGAVCLARVLWPGVNLASATIHGSLLDITLNMDVLYAPVFLYGMKNLLELVKNTKILPLLGKIGQESMLMWFLHCLFFNCCARYTQPLLFWPRLAVLILPWGLALCYTTAKLLRHPLNHLLGKAR